MERKVTLVVGKNGSIEVLNDDQDVEPWAELLTLGVILLFSTVLNFTAVGCSILCKARGTAEISPLTMALLVTNAFDAIINQTIALAFLAFWPSSSPPRALCQFSSMTFLGALLLQPLYVLMNFLYVLYVQKRTSLVLLRFFHTLPPVMACVLSIPIILLPNAIPTHQIINRHLCGIAAENLLYSTSVVIFGFFSSWAAIAFCVAIRKFMGEPAHRCCVEDRDLSYALAAVVLAVILVLPAVASFAIVSMTNPTHLSTYKDSGDGLVFITGTYDTVLTWAKFSFDVFSPLSVLLFYKNVRQECVHVLGSKSLMPIGCRPSVGSRRSRETRAQGSPILFLTSNGLMLMSSANARSPLIETCDLLEQNPTSPTALTLSNPIPTLSPVPSETKKPEKTGKRKIVRFAQSIIEIPASQ